MAVLSMVHVSCSHHIDVAITALSLQPIRLDSTITIDANFMNFIVR